MIDDADDFENMVRKMFDMMLGRSSSSRGPNGETTFGFKISSHGLNDTPSMNKDEPIVENIELDDRKIVIVDGLQKVEEIQVRIESLELFIESGQDATVLHKISIDSPVNIDDSFYTFRNGVLEINLLKDKEKTESIESAGYLKME